MSAARRTLVRADVDKVSRGRATGKLRYGELGRQHAYATPARLLDATAVLEELLSFGSFRARFAASLSREHAHAFVVRSEKDVAGWLDGAGKY